MAGDAGRVEAGNRIVASASVPISAPAEPGVASAAGGGGGLASCARLAGGRLIVKAKSIVRVRSIASVDRTMAVTLLVVLVRLGRHSMSVRWEDSVCRRRPQLGAASIR